MAKYSVGYDGDSLEAEADRLLREAGCFNRKSGIHTEYQIGKAKREDCEVSLEQTFLDSGICHPCINALFDCLWGEIVSGAKKCGCTQRQIDYLELRCSGNTYQEIADATKLTWGCNKSTVAIDLKTAAQRIQHIPAFGLWSVLAEVFHMSIPRIKAIIINK